MEEMRQQPRLLLDSARELTEDIYLIAYLRIPSIAALPFRATDMRWNCKGDSISSETNSVIVTSIIYNYLTYLS